MSPENVPLDKDNLKPQKRVGPLSSDIDGGWAWVVGVAALLASAISSGNPRLRRRFLSNPHCMLYFSFEYTNL